MLRNFARGMDAAVFNVYEVLSKAKLQVVKSTGMSILQQNSQNASLKLPKAILSTDRNQAIIHLTV